MGHVCCPHSCTNDESRSQTYSNFFYDAAFLPLPMINMKLKYVWSFINSLYIGGYFQYALF